MLKFEKKVRRQKVKVESCNPCFRHITLGRTPLDKWSTRRKDLTTHNTHKRQIDIHATGGVRTRNLGKRAALDQRLRQSGQWDRPFWHLVDSEYSSGLGFTAQLCDTSKCLYVNRIRKSKFGVRKSKFCYERRIRDENLQRTKVWVVRKKVRKSRTSCN